MWTSQEELGRQGLLPLGERLGQQHARLEMVGSSQQPSGPTDPEPRGLVHVFPPDQRSDYPM